MSNTSASEKAIAEIRTSPSTISPRLEPCLADYPGRSVVNRRNVGVTQK